MSLREAAALELGHRSVYWRIAVVIAGQIDAKPVRGRERFINMLGVIGPVGGDAESALGAQFVRRELEEGCLNQAALVMAFPRPGLFKVKIDASERAVRDLFRQYLDRVVHD